MCVCFSLGICWKDHLGEQTVKYLYSVSQLCNSFVCLYNLSKIKQFTIVQDAITVTTNANTT